MLGNICLWILYFICVLAPYSMLLPLSTPYFFIFIIAAFVLPLISLLVANLIKKDTPYMTKGAQTLKMRRALMHPICHLFIATSIFTVLAVSGKYLGSHDMFSLVSFFKEIMSAATGEHLLEAIFMAVPIPLAVLIYFLKWSFSHRNMSLRRRGFWYITLYVLALAMIAVPAALLGVRLSDYHSFLGAFNNKIFLYALVGVILFVDACITFGLMIRHHKFKKYAKIRMARLGDVDDPDDYTVKELIAEEGYQLTEKKANKLQKKLEKKVTKENDKLHKKVDKLEKKEANQEKVEEPKASDVKEPEAPKACQPQNQPLNEEEMKAQEEAQKAQEEAQKAEEEAKKAEEEAKKAEEKALKEAKKAEKAEKRAEKKALREEKREDNRIKRLEKRASRLNNRADRVSGRADKVLDKANDKKAKKAEKAEMRAAEKQAKEAPKTEEQQ